MTLVKINLAYNPEDDADDVSSESLENNDYMLSDHDDSFKYPPYNIVKDPDHIAHQKRKSARNLESIQLLISSKHPTIHFIAFSLTTISSIHWGHILSQII